MILEAFMWTLSSFASRHPWCAGLEWFYVPAFCSSRICCRSRRIQRWSLPTKLLPESCYWLHFALHLYLHWSTRHFPISTTLEEVKPFDLGHLVSAYLCGFALLRSLSSILYSFVFQHHSLTLALFAKFPWSPCSKTEFNLLSSIRLWQPWMGYHAIAFKALEGLFVVAPSCLR